MQPVHVCLCQSAIRKIAKQRHIHVSAIAAASIHCYTDLILLHRCAQSLELTQMAKKGAHFRCPQHYCTVCQKSGDGVDMVKCIRCPTAYHSSCMPKEIPRLLPHAKVTRWHPDLQHACKHASHQPCATCLPLCILHDLQEHDRSIL